MPHRSKGKFRYPMDNQVRFVDQTKRILFLWSSAPVVVLVAVFTQSAWPDEFVVGELFEQAGIILVFACILGRCWAALHIGGRKNAKLVQTGPYRYSRNPLYFFSCLGLAGMGFLFESAVLGVVLFTFGYLAFHPVLKSESALLSEIFGSEYDAYSRRVSEFFPTLANKLTLKSEDRLDFSQSALKRTFLDACYFLLVFPFVEIIDWLHNSSRIYPAVFLY